MPSNTNYPQRAATLRKTGFRVSASVTLSKQSEGVNEELQARILVGTHNNGELSDVATLVACNVLSTSSMKDNDQTDAVALDIATPRM